MAPISTLIPLQLVCQLAIPESPGINENGTLDLPEGYIAYPDIGLAYKVHNGSVLWNVGRKRCIVEGGNLAVIDSTKKLEYVLKQRNFTGFTHVGLHNLFGDSEWISLKTGLPVGSIPWASGEPVLTVRNRANFGYCAMIKSPSTGRGLGNFNCNEIIGNFVCELPIPNNNAAEVESVGDKILAN